MDMFNKNFNHSFVLLLMFISTLIFYNGCDASTKNKSDSISNTHEIRNITLDTGDVLEGTYESGTIVTIKPGATVDLKGTVRFDKGSMLVLLEGVTIKAQAFQTLTYLIIDRGARIYALGTKERPITFTSYKASGTRGRQDWGGIIINGYAPINVDGNISGEADSGNYGGNDPHDSSGMLKYVRVYFAGQLYNGLEELNGITFQGVGDNTIVDYLQVHNCADDGIEIFGGTVNLKHIVSTANGDDAIDWIEGWQGKAQFVAIAIVEGDSGDPRGIEGDNLGDDNGAAPVSTIQMYNVSVICDTAGYADTFMIFRRGTQATIVNGYIGAGANVNMDAYGVKLTEDLTSVTLQHFLIEGNIDTLDDSSSTGDKLTATDNVTETVSAATYLNTGNISTRAELETYGSSVFIPVGNIISGINPPDDGFFDASANFVGAVKLGNNWIDGWTSFPAD